MKYVLLSKARPLKLLEKLLILETMPQVEDLKCQSFWKMNRKMNTVANFPRNLESNTPSFDKAINR